MNKFKSLILVAALAVGFTATQGATVSYTETIPPNSSWVAPTPPPLTTSIKVMAVVGHHWYLNAHNDADAPALWDLSVSHAVAVNTSAALHGIASTSNFGGTLPAFTSTLIDDNATVTLEYTYTLPVDINTFIADTTIAVSYWLEYTPTGITIPTTFPSPDNTTTVTVTYTYGVTQPPDDDDDCDEDHGRRHHKRGNRRR